jgi:hypothetical protein
MGGVVAQTRSQTSPIIRRSRPLYCGLDHV